VKLVLLPGMDGTGRLFANFITALGSEFDAQVVSYPQDASLQYAELEEFARNATGESEPFVLVAESFSVSIAIRWAASAPENLKGLVLCAGFVSSPLKGARRLVALALGPILFRWRPPDFMLRWLLVGRGGDSSLLVAVRATLSEVKPDVLAARLRLVLNCDERVNLRQLKLPILFIRPTRDQTVPVSAYEEVRATNPMVEMKVVDGPHLVLQTNSQTCADFVSGFVKASWFQVS
jgi:pimeloyl-[acyl-carrier protein] methyl ester esterase